MDYKQIRKKRKANKLTVKVLAKNLGIDEGNLYKWEKGTKITDPVAYNALDAWLKEPEMENVPEKKEKLETGAPAADQKNRPSNTEETVQIPRNYFDLLLKNSSMLENTTLANSESARANRITAEALLAHVLQSLVVGLDEVDLSRVEKIAPELYSRALELVAKQKDKREGNLGSKK